MASINEVIPGLFNIMGNTLPALVGQIPNPNNNLMISLTQIRQALRDISFVYQTKLRNNEVRCNWGDPVYRCAYVFLYFVKHSNLVYEALVQNRLYFDIFWASKKSDVINVCSIGGGPGSDIAGVIAFLGKLQHGKALRCSVLDFYPEWESTWLDIRKQMPQSVLQDIADVQYRKFDMTKEAPFSHDVLNIIRTADLVTFVKSFSTISTVRSVYSTVLPNIMEALKPGAFVLFIDNSCNRDANASFKRIAQNAGLNVLHDYVHDMRLSLPASSLVDGFSAVFDYRPLRNCSVTIYLMQKPYYETIPNWRIYLMHLMTYIMNR